MYWIPLVLFALLGLVASFQLSIYLRSKRLVGTPAPELNGIAKTVHGEGQRALIYFHSPGCRPCRHMTPIIEKLAAQYDNVVSVDVTRDMTAAQKYDIRATPATVLVQDGRITAVLLGAQAPQKLQSFLEAGVT